MKSGNKRNSISIGQLVRIVQKQHQKTGQLTEGLVKRILTKATQHPHGIKVALDSGEIGRVKEILDDETDPIDWADLL